MNELSTASSEILESVSTLMSTSEVVKTASAEMQVGSSESMKSILHIKELSAAAVENITKVAGLTEDLNNVSLQVSAFGNQNKYNNSLLKGLLGIGTDHDIAALVGNINEYIEYHFRDEEKMMKSYNYPELKDQMELHAIYENEFSLIEKKLREGEFDANLLIEIQDKIINWLLDHIARVDKKYGKFIADLKKK